MAAELGWQRHSERKRMTEMGENGRPGSCLFIREDRLKQCEKRGDQTSLSSGPDASVFGTVSKSKDPLEDMAE